MFKLIKITGARTNVPETVSAKIDGTTAYSAGCVYYLGDGQLSKSPLTSYDLKFIALESVAENSGKTKISGYLVTDNMVFETDVYNDVNSIKVGNMLAGYLNTDGDVIGADSIEGLDAVVLNADEARTKHKILVALKW
ncbi:MAG: hypothetical protein E7612_04530 [Ruminococcaceae bacterium]|nr:hypothetical protein [Oscillospiraceae bacterium]